MVNPTVRSVVAVFSALSFSTVAVLASLPDCFWLFVAGSRFTVFVGLMTESATGSAWLSCHPNILPFMENM